jgi:8-oxo-dGTP pyrophosphatase MutT (NUDIX family)
MKVLEATPNPFRGIHISTETLPETAEEFRLRLTASLAAWQEAGFRLVWVEIPITKASLIPVAVEAGFVFHHSTETHLMLTRRLQEDAFVPGYASHYIGVGGVVLNEQQELLVVSERYRGDTAKPYYKLPGGALYAGEHIADGIIREVYEETGVQTKFEAVVCFRHWHGYRYGKSDIYFVCRLSPLSQDITKQDDEIDECLWMPVHHYLTNDDVAFFNKRIVQAALKSTGIGSTWLEGYNDPAKREFFFPDIPD